tara:strand:+ start:283 stop:867 length:585 start_codon:yes stop_codon:yes gene_type:complete
MEMDNRAMMNEVGGAFMVSWMVLSGAGLGSLEGAVLMAAAWMAIGGAHILPVVTWCHMMTGDLSDTDGMMGNAMLLLSQVVGAALAIALMTEAGAIETGWEAAAWEAPELWGALTMIAGGAVFWTIYTRCDAWVAAFSLMALAGAMGGMDAAHEMGASLLSGADGIQDVALDWIVDGLLVGIGARVGVMVDDAV